jgi:ferredoxin-NADP reductase
VRLDVRDIPKRLRQRAAFHLCGSPGFVEAWEVLLRRAGVARHRIEVERFE